MTIVTVSMSMAIVSMAVVSFRISLPLAVEVTMSMAVVSMVMAIVSVSMVWLGLSLPLAVVETISVVSEMAVSVVAVSKVSVGEPVVSVVSVVSVRRGLGLSHSLGVDCGHQEEGEEDCRLHVSRCEQARDPSRTPHVLCVPMYS